MPIYKICIIHLNQIGDLVFSLPLLKALRDHYPGASIHSIARPYLVELLKSSPYVSEIIPRHGGIQARWRLLRDIRRARYDMIISLAHSEESLLLAAFSGAPLKAGFSHFPWDLCLDVKEQIEGHNGWYNNTRLLRRLNIPVTKNDYVGLLAADKPPDDIDLPEKFVVISPGASKKRLTKTWEEEKFARLIALLHDRHALTPVLVGGADDQESNLEIMRGARQEAGRDFNMMNLTGAIGLRDLCAVIQKARLFVGIDSGVMHLASALDVPVVALFGPTDPFYVGPHNRRSIVVRQDTMACVPCYLQPCEHRECMRGLDVDTVAAACRRVLSDTGTATDHQDRLPA